MPDGLNSMMDSTCHLWTEDPFPHGINGVGKVLREEDGIYGAILTITTEDELGSM